MWSFKTKTVYLGYSVQRFDEVRQVLRAHGVEYRARVGDRSGGLLSLGRGTVRGSFGSFGIDDRAAREYEVLVSSKDCETARYLVETGGA